MEKVLYLCIVVCFYAMQLHAEDNKCEKLMQELRDSNTVCCIGYGYSSNKEIAEEQAANKAKKALLEILCDSVAKICYHVEVLQDERGEFLSILYFDKEDYPSKFYFHKEGILNNIIIQCQRCTRKKDRKYEASCVMSAPRKEFSRASNCVMFQILMKMSDYLDR